MIRRLSFLLLLSSALYAASLQYIEEYPPQGDISGFLESEPEQGDVELSNFIFEYRDRQYIIQPVHTYELWGLVVSHNNISSITDAYHNSDSVDFKDLCVVWGENADSTLLNNIHFWSEPWTCFFKTDDATSYAKFNPDKLSNNHLLARRDEVRELIQDVRVGDQIHLKGLLVNYAPKEFPSYIRSTSTVRTDTGNGACEVFFVEAARVLHEANSGWRKIHGFSKQLSLLLLICIPLLWVYDIQVNFQERKKEANRKPISGRYRKK